MLHDIFCIPIYNYLVATKFYNYFIIYGKIFQ